MRVLISLLLLFSIVIAGCSQAGSATENNPAPEFTLNGIDGVKTSLSDLRGKSIVLLVFWATWCPYCVEEIPELNKMADEYKDKVQIIAIDIKEDLNRVTEFAKKRNIKYKILLDSTGEIAQKYRVRGIPANVLIDKDGKMLYNGNSLQDCIIELRGHNT